MSGSSDVLTPILLVTHREHPVFSSGQLSGVPNPGPQDLLTPDRGNPMTRVRKFRKQAGQ